MANEQVLAAVLQRLAQLEATNAVRNAINRYMEICDGLSAQTDLDELMALFDEDCSGLIQQDTFLREY